TAYRQAALAHPRNPAALVNLANLLAESEAVEAQTLFERALELSPEQPQAHQGLGKILFAQGNADAAEDHWHRGYGGANSTIAQTFRGEGKGLGILVLAS